MSRPKSHELFYTIVLTAADTERTMDFENEDPVVVLRQAFEACESCAIQSLDLNHLDLAIEVVDVVVELLPKIPVNRVHLFNVWNGDGGTMDSVLPIMRGLSEADLRPDPAEQATDATLRVCRETGVSRVYICAADLISDSSAISEEGIFDFCFGAEVKPSSGSVRELDVDRPHLTPQFMGRLIAMSEKASSKTSLVLKVDTAVVFETTAFRPVPCDRHPGLCYRFDGEIPFQLHWNTADGKLELRRGVEVDDHMVQPEEDESDSDDD